MSTHVRLVQSGKTASGGCSAGPRFVRSCSATDYYYYYYYIIILYYYLVENLSQMVLKLSEEVQKLRKDNEIFKSSIPKMVVSVPVSSVRAIKSAPCGTPTSAAGR
jgi:hypothetical protein